MRVARFDALIEPLRANGTWCWLPTGARARYVAGQRIALAAVLLTVCGWPGAPPAQGAGRAGHVSVYRPHFQQILGPAIGRWIETNGRLVAIAISSEEVELIDQRTGETTLVGTAGQTGRCRSVWPEFAGVWLASRCWWDGTNYSFSSPYVENLYSIATGRWYSITMPRGCLYTGVAG